ncbi:MAG TPA: DoxX family membrane protein [Steroidobacteraceae bacterium]|nr:DoxX family membrane protein [Steroidobacteraceae bacterium]
MNTHALPYALGAILLGAVGIWFHDFAMQWQPVPAGFPMRAQFAVVTGLLLILGGGETLSGKFARAGAVLLFAVYGLWVLVLHVPLIVLKPADLGTWNGVAEIVFMTTGAIALYAGARGTRGRLATAVCLVTGSCALVFGATHFKYAQFTATMVPAWIPPNQIFWAYATGVAHVAAGLSLVSGIRAQLGATLLAVMMALFVVLVHIPRVYASPGEHLEWIMLGVALSLSGAAWLVRKYAA